MTNEFDDYNYKNIDTRVRLSLKQTREKFLSPWELSSFISNFNTYYYRAEVLNTIAIALSNNIHPKDILIFDESFKLNRLYGKLARIGIDGKDLKYIYTLGKPISMIPNINIFVLNLLFKFWRQLNEFLYHVKARRLANSEIYLYYKRFKDNSFDSLFEELKKHSDEVLNKKNLKTSEIKRYNNLFDMMKKEYAEYTDNLEFFNSCNSKFIENNTLFEIDTENDIYKKYYLRFYNLITNVQRPIVAVYNEESNTITILCRAHINKKQRNSVTLDLKSLTHNSPIEAIIDGGTSIINGVVDNVIKAYETYKDNKRKDELHMQSLLHQGKLNELEILEKENKLKYNEEKRKSKISLQSIEVVKKLKEIDLNYEVDAIDNLDDSLIKNKLKEIENNNIDNTKKLLKRNDFEVNDVSILDRVEFKDR